MATATVTITKKSAAKKVAKAPAVPDINKTALKYFRAQNEIAQFNSKVMEALAPFENERKRLNDMHAQIKTQLEIGMEEYYKQTGQKKLENPFVALTYKAPHTQQKIDSTRLRSEQPKIAAKYTMTIDVKGSVTIKVK